MRMMPHDDIGTRRDDVPRELHLEWLRVVLELVPPSQADELDIDPTGAHLGQDAADFGQIRRAIAMVRRDAGQQVET